MMRGFSVAVAALGLLVVLVENAVAQDDRTPMSYWLGPLLVGMGIMLVFSMHRWMKK